MYLACAKKDCSPAGYAQFVAYGKQQCAYYAGLSTGGSGSTIVTATRTATATAPVVTETVGGIAGGPSSSDSNSIPLTTPTDKRLSKGTRAGIGVGIAVGILLIFGLAAFLREKRLKRKAAARAAQQPGAGEVAPMEEGNMAQTNTETGAGWTTIVTNPAQPGATTATQSPAPNKNDAHVQSTML